MFFAIEAASTQQHKSCIIHSYSLSNWIQNYSLHGPKKSQYHRPRKRFQQSHTKSSVISRLASTGTPNPVARIWLDLAWKVGTPGPVVVGAIYDNAFPHPSGSAVAIHLPHLVADSIWRIWTMLPKKLWPMEPFIERVGKHQLRPRQRQELTGSPSARYRSINPYAWMIDDDCNIIFETAIAIFP